MTDDQEPQSFKDYWTAIFALWFGEKYGLKILSEFTAGTKRP